jgi:DNA polymerase III gamma/tau subunit
MEKHAANCRVILTCNYPHQIIDPIRSRCTVYNFKPIPASLIEKAVADICKLEDIRCNAGGVTSLAREAGGDMRRALSILERFKGDNRVLTSDMIARGDEENLATLNRIVGAAINNNVHNAYSRLSQMIAAGSMLSHVLRDISRYSLKFTKKSGTSYPDAVIAKICEAAMVCSYYLTQGVCETTVMLGFIAKLAGVK